MKKKYSYCVLLVYCLLTGAALKGVAQDRDAKLFIPEIVSVYYEPPATADAPLFFKMIKSGETNIKKIEAAFEEYYIIKEKQEKPALKTGPGEESAFEETDLYARYYRRWRRGIDEYIMPNGKIRRFSQNELKTLHTRLAQKQQPAIGRNQRVGSPTWSLVGPVNTYWRKNDNAAQTAAPWQVNVYCIAVAPSNPNILYCGTETGGIFKTTDKGLSWVSVSSGYNFMGSPAAIVVHPADPNTAYVGIHRNIIKTTDGGATWTSVYYNATAPADPVSIIIDPSNPNIVIAATASGLIRSTDGGATWATSFTNMVYDVEFKPGDAATVYAVRLNGQIVEFVKSTDGGVSFTVSSTGWPSGVTNSSGALLAVTPADANVIYASWLSSGGARFMKSTDAGANWTTYSTGNFSSWDQNNGQGFFDFALMASPTDANKAIVGITSAYRTDNGGSSFTQIGGYWGPFPLHPDIQSAVAIGGDAWIATDGGVNYSADFFTAHAESRTTGIYATDFWGFAQGWNEDIMVGGRYHNGNTAISEQYPYNKAIRLGGAEAPTGWLYPGQPRRASFSDIGTSILPENFSDPVTGQSNISKYPTMDGYGYHYSELLTHPDYFKTIYIGQGNTLWKSEDNGSSFAAIETFPLKVRRFVVSRSNPNYIYLATESYLYKSTDGGSTFAQLSSGPGAGDWFIAVSAFNENVVWFSNRNGSNGNKIYKTTNGGASFTNITSSVLDNRRIRAIAFDGGNPGSVYVAASPDFSVNPSGVLPDGKVFYYNNTTSAWEDHSAGLPASQQVLRMFPFYRDGKLRVAGNMGVWEANLVNSSVPQVQPIASTKLIRCIKDTVQFEDYSILNHHGASWQWSFNPSPAWISNAGVRNPRVLFSAPGTYDVTLTVNTPGGTFSKTVPAMVTVDAVSECTSFDTIPGNALDPRGNNAGSFAKTDEPLNITTNTFTFSAWVKPNGIQPGYTGIVESSPTIERIALNFRNNNELGYHWPSSTVTNWAISSGLFVPEDRWSHVAVVVEPTQVTFYLNGQSVTRSTTNMPALFDRGLAIGTMYWFEGSRTMNGSIDEVCLWNRALSATEIRQLRHLTKSPTNTTGLVGYFQFNETTGSMVYDKIGGKHATISGAGARVVSTAPVGGGVSAAQTITSAGAYNFGNTGLSLTTQDAGPDGEIWATRLNGNPDAQPDTNGSGNQYWIFNNYGVNKSFNALTNLSMQNVNQVNTTTISDLNRFNLYQRAQNADGLTWGTVKCHPTSGNAAMQTLHFTHHCTIDSVSQFAITYGSPVPVTPPLLVDTVPGKALVCNGNTEPKFAIADALNINTNTISMSAWIKPNGTQTADVGILLTPSGSNTGLFLNNTSGINTLRFSWNDGHWHINTNLVVPPNEWSHVAMTVSPTQITVYVNGKPFTYSGTFNAINFDQGFSFGSDSRSSFNNSRKFLGLIDEVCFWNKTLTTDEVRATRHLTKEATTPNLVGYYQFNELINGDMIDDKVSTRNAYTIHGAQLTASDAPVGRGVSAKQYVTTAGGYTFAAPGVNITFDANTPDGDLWVSRINQSPDQKPNLFKDGGHYWIVNNYGANASFSSLPAIKFYATGLVTAFNEASPSQFNLYKRGDNAYGATWGPAFCNGMAASITDNNSVTFGASCNITSFSQFTLSDDSTPLPVILVYFKGTVSDHYKNNLEWKIDGAPDTDKIIVQRSMDGVSFTDIAAVPVAEARKVYTYTDEVRLEGAIYYRLKWISTSGIATFSNIAKLVSSKVLSAEVYPNPAGNSGTIVVTLPRDANVEIDILNASGQLVQSVINRKLTAGTTTVELNTAQLAAGYYFIKIKTDKADRMMKKLIVQH